MIVGQSVHERRLVIDEQRIDRIFAKFDQAHEPGLSVGISLNGAPVYRKAFGLASMELPLALSPSTRIRIGSTTKYFTSFLYLTLCRQGLAGMDDPLVRYFPQFEPFARDVTARHLMSNTSGLRDVFHVVSALRGHLDGHVGRNPTSTTQLLDLYLQMGDREAAPGETWMYNNGGFLLLGLIVERILGASLGDCLRDLLFKPLEMHDSFMKSSDRQFTENTATCHHPSGDRFVRSEFGYDYAGGGSLVSTTDDMLRWMAAVEDGRVGDETIHAAMRAPQRLNNGRAANYGLGLFIHPHRGLPTFAHGGSWVGTSTQLLFAPSIGLGIIVMANRGDVSATSLAEQLIDACVTGLEPDFRPRIKSLPTGSFRSRRTGRVVTIPSADSSVAVVDGLALPLAPEANGKFSPCSPLAHLQLQFSAVEEGSGAGLNLDDFGDDDQLEPIEPAADDRLERFSGLFRSVTLCCELEVRLADRQLTAITRSSFGSMEFQLTPLGPGLFHARPVDFIDAILSFDEEAHHLQFRNFYTRDLEFVRQ